MKTIRLLLLFLGMVLSANAQTKVTGQVTSSDDNAVAGVIVKVTIKGKMLGYGVTDVKGYYSIPLKQSLSQEAMITFCHISYETASELLPSTKTDVLIRNKVLKQKNLILKEVTVKARPILLKGDTLSYNLASFLGKGDVTLEDGLKRLPGVSVSNNGSVSYMGHTISEFQIEGLDLLGGNYSQATKNMKTDHVTQVEVMRGWNKHKVDKNEQSNAVAFNVKLAPKAKLKPIGTEEIGAGYMENGYNRWLDKLGLTGMLFTPQFQTICSTKTGNYHDYGRSDWGMDVLTIAARLLPSWESEGSVPADHIFQRNSMASLNAIQKLDSLRTFRVNADYCYHRQTSEALTQSSYLGSDGNYMTIGEHSSPYQSQHLAKLSAVYDEDASNHYLYENFVLKAKFETNEGNMSFLTNNKEKRVVQHRSLSSFEVSNTIRYAIRHGEHRADISSIIAFLRTPTLCLNFERGGQHSVQTAQSTTINMDHSVDYSLKLGKKHRIHMPVSLNGSLEFIETDWLRRGVLSGHNCLRGGQLSPSISPSYDWTSADKRLYLQGRLPLTLNFLWFGNIRDQQLQFIPDVMVRYTFNTNNKLEFSSNYSQQIADVAQMINMQLADTIQTSYRSYMAPTTSFIGHCNDWHTSLDWYYQQPLSFFTFRASLSHNCVWRNMLPSQAVSGIDLTNTSLAHDSRSQSTMMNFSMSKNILPIFAKFGMNGSWGFGSSQVAVNGQKIEPHTYNVSCGIEFSMAPVAWIEMKYNCMFGWNHTAYNDINNKQTSFGQNAELHVFPVSVLDVSAKYSYSRHEVAGNQYKSLSLLGASAQWRFKKRYVFCLELNNLFNQRHYAYTVFDGVNTFSYDQYLCGRNTMLSVMMNL